MAATTLDTRIARHAARRHGVVTRLDLLAFGASRSAIRHRVDSRRLVALHPGVFLVAGAPRTWHAEVLAATIAAGPEACASHLTAAALFGFPGFGRRAPEVAVPRARRPTAGTRIAVHHVGSIPEHHRRVVDYIAVTSIARTLFDLCGCVHARRAERALDHCLARKMVTLEACGRVFTDLRERGRPGTAFMRALLDARGHGYVAPASELERKMLELLSDAGLPAPAREIDVGDADGWVGRVELVYRTAKVLIEVDGRVHHTALDDYERDRVRDNRLVADGWRVLRFTYEQIAHHPHDVVRIVRRALRGRAPQPIS